MCKENPAETVKYRDYKIEIYRDDNVENPRDWDNLGKMVCWHSRYKLGDKHEFDTPEDFDNFCAETDVLRLPLYLYDHSGITMSTSLVYPYNDQWDAGQVGWIYVSFNDLVKEYGNTKKESIKKAKDYLQGEIQTYDDYLTGNVYGFIIEGEPEIEFNSVWGFYGYDHEKSGLLESAREIINFIPEQSKLDFVK